MDWKTFLLTSGVLVSAACGASPSMGPAGEEAADVPGQNPSAVDAAWSEVMPGGETACTDGSEFHFLVRDDSPEKLLFFLEGGGGCWNKTSCNPDGSPTAKLNLDKQEEPDAGIFDFGDSANPFKGYSVVYVPYCSGDVHIGANDVVYPDDSGTGEPLQVSHRGRANVQAALDWTYSNFDSVEDIFVTGVSAGAVPTPLYASMLANHFDKAHVASLGDGAGGYRRTTSMNDRLEDWGVFNHIDDVPGFEKLSPETWSYEQLYVHGAQAHPGIVFARFDYSADPAQWRFLSDNSEFDTLLANILANNADIQGEVSNFRTYIASGEEHTIMQKSEFYNVSANGVSFVGWVERLAGGEPVSDVSCEGCAR